MLTGSSAAAMFQGYVAVLMENSARSGQFLERKNAEL